MFGRRKKSAANLGSSASTSSLQLGPANASVEALGGAGGSAEDAVPLKGVKNVFKRKSKAENPSAGSLIGSIDENGHALVGSGPSTTEGRPDGDGDSLGSDESADSQS